MRVYNASEFNTKEQAQTFVKTKDLSSYAAIYSTEEMLEELSGDLKANGNSYYVIEEKEQEITSIRNIISTRVAIIEDIVAKLISIVDELEIKGIKKVVPEIDLSKLYLTDLFSEGIAQGWYNLDKNTLASLLHNKTTEEIGDVVKQMKEGFAYVKRQIEEYQELDKLIKIRDSI
jgi:hypothetical protein